MENTQICKKTERRLKDSPPELIQLIGDECTQKFDKRCRREKPRTDSIKTDVLTPKPAQPGMTSADAPTARAHMATGPSSV